MASQKILKCECSKCKKNNTVDPYGEISEDNLWVAYWICAGCVEKYRPAFICKTCGEFQLIPEEQADEIPYEIWLKLRDKAQDLATEAGQIGRNTYTFYI